MIDPPTRREIAGEVEELLRHVPEFTQRYLALVEGADTDPEAAAALAELADYAAGLARRAEEARSVLVRLMAGIEALSNSSADAEDLVAGAFLDCLCPDDLRRLAPWMGPSTRSVLDELELPPGRAVREGLGRRPPPTR